MFEKIVKNRQLMQNTKWFCAIAGSGVVLGILSYFHGEKRQVYTSWTTNFTPSVKWDHNWDKREVDSLIRPRKKKNVTDESEDNRINAERERLTPTATRHLFLVRHGQYVDGTTDKERKLTVLGQQQAEATALRFKQLGFNYTVIHQSTMTRAMETASYLHKMFPDVPLVSTDMLVEGAPIPPEPPLGHYRPEVQQFYEDGARIEGAFRKYIHRADARQKDDSYEIFVCHANVIRYFVCRALQFPPEAWLRFSLHNCSITWLAIRPNGRVRFMTIGDCGHIPAGKLTSK